MMTTELPAHVVPLVDIMLVLLIIFMVTTQFVQDELRNRMPPNVEVQLPKAASAEDSNPSLRPVINAKETSIRWCDLNLAALKEKVVPQAQGKKADAIIAADERVPRRSCWRDRYTANTWCRMSR